MKLDCSLSWIGWNIYDKTSLYSIILDCWFFCKDLKSKCNGFTKVFNFITLTKVLDVKLQPATFPKLTRFHRCQIFWIDSPFIQSPCKFHRLTYSSSLPLTKNVLLTLTQKARSEVCFTYFATYKSGCEGLCSGPF